MGPVPDGGANENKRGKLFFLMLAEHRILIETIWYRFFDEGEHGVTYRVFVHCKHEKSCHELIMSPDIFEIVSTVPSQYCENLVSPMVALLRAALAHSQPGNTNDKFIFTVHDSLPVKPFPSVYRMLTENMEGAAIFDSAMLPSCGIFKAAQWSVLSYWHAVKMVSAAEKVSNFNRSMLVVPKGCAACLDENFPIVSVFGEEALQQYSAVVPKSLQVKRFMYVDWNSQPVQKDKGVSAGSANDEDGAADGEAAGEDRGANLGAALNRQVEEDEDGEEGGIEGPWGPSELIEVSLELLTKLRDDPNIIFMRKVGRRSRVNGTQSMPQAWRKYVFRDSTGSWGPWVRKVTLSGLAHRKRAPKH